MIITIDGPASSGKSTVARLLADELGFVYLNSGLLFRALSYILVHRYGYTAQTIAHPAERDITDVLNSGDMRYAYDKEQGARIIYKGDDITRHLKLPDIDEWASLVSQDSDVRRELLVLQKKYALENNSVVEGRDCGSVVFPQADYKFFLTASVDVRAYRWQHDQARRGVFASLDEAKAFIMERDERDSTRVVSPLVVPQGARIIDDSGLNAAQTVALIKSFISQSADQEDKPRLSKN